MEVSGQLHAGTDLCPRKEPHYPQNRSLGATQRWSGHLQEKFLAPIGIQNMDFPVPVPAMPSIPPILVFLFLSLLHAFAKLQELDCWLHYVCLPTCLSAKNNLDPTGQISVKLYGEGFHLNLSRKFMCGWNWTKISGTLHKHLSMLMTISHCILLWQWWIQNCEQEQKVWPQQINVMTIPEESSTRIELIWTLCHT